MILYCVNDYLEVCRWFLSYRDAEWCYLRALEDRPQEKSEMLEIVRYRTHLPPSQVALAALNGDGWADEITTVVRAKPRGI